MGAALNHLQQFESARPSTKSGAGHSFHRLGARVQMDHVEIQKGRVPTAVLGGARAIKCAA
jgi:hypothetical protein